MCSGTLALIFILFDGGLEIRVRELLGGAATGALLAVVVFGITALVCAGLAHLVGGLTPVNALLLGMAFGGAGVVIVIPLIQHLGVRPRAVTIVTVEAAVSDVLVVLGVVGLSTALAFSRLEPVGFARSVAENFAVGLSLGLLAGFLWARLLARSRFVGPIYVMTLAALFLLYAIVEALRGSGPIAVLAFGFVLGNSRRGGELARAKRRGPRLGAPVATDPVFGPDLTGFHQEVVFLIRTVFFVSLGASIDPGLFRDPRFLLLGTLLALGVAVSRWIGVRLVMGEKEGLAPWDRQAVALMFPLGLAAAALSLLPSERFGLPGTEEFGSIALVVVVLTNLFATVLVFVQSRRRVHTPGVRAGAA